MVPPEGSKKRDKAKVGTPPASGPMEDSGKARKVTIACDTCRTKRQKCDGAQPVCRACLDLNIPCTYSRQARRRGPPLGFLRHVEVRLHINDAFLGFVLTQDPSLLSSLLPHVRVFASAQSAASLGEGGKRSEREKEAEVVGRWDEYAARWRESEVSKTLDGVSARFATPVSRPELESPLRTNTTGGAAAAILSTSGSFGDPATTAGDYSETQHSGLVPSSTSTHLSNPSSGPLTPHQVKSSPGFIPPPFAQTNADPSSFASIPSTSPISLHLPSSQAVDPTKGIAAGASSNLAPNPANVQVKEERLPVSPWPSSAEQFNRALADLWGDADHATPHASSPISVEGGARRGTLEGPSAQRLDREPFNFDGSKDALSDIMMLPPKPSAPNVSRLATGRTETFNALVAGPGSKIFIPLPLLTPHSRPAGRIGTDDLLEGDRKVERVPTETDSVRYEGTGTGMHHQALESSYTGTFWRRQQKHGLDDADYNSPSPSSAAASLPQAPSSSAPTSPSLVSQPSTELPPAAIQQHCAEIYLQFVHPIFPLLSRSSIIGREYKPRPLVLALCAYCICLSDGLNDRASIGDTKGLEGDALRQAAEVWYEEARAAAMTSLLRRQTSIETIQTVLFLVLRDQGRGKESQAWLLMGLVVRLAIDLGLHLHSSAWVDVPEEVKTMRRRVWGVVCILDLLIALQLGRPSAIFDAHWASEVPFTIPPPPDVGKPSSLETYKTPNPMYFAYTASLCLIVSRINYQLYLSPPGSEAQNVERLEVLRNELERWHDHFPGNLSLKVKGPGIASLPVLDVNLLYNVAVILLYRPFRLHPTIPAVRISLEAASTFSTLLAYYRNLQRLRRSNPHIIYLIFTCAIAHLSGLRSLRSNAASSPSNSTRSAPSPGHHVITSDSGSIYSGSPTSQLSHAASLPLAYSSVQSDLLSCADALKEMSLSWPLAERCHRILTGLMEAEGLLMLGDSMGMQSGPETRPVFSHFDMTDSSSPEATTSSNPGGPRGRSSTASRSHAHQYQQQSVPLQPYHTPSAPASRQRPRSASARGQDAGGEHDEDAGGRRPPSRSSSHRAHPYAQLTRLSSTSSVSSSGRPLHQSHASSSHIREPEQAAFEPSSFGGPSSFDPSSPPHSLHHRPSRPSFHLPSDPVQGPGSAYLSPLASSAHDAYYQASTLPIPHHGGHSPPAPAVASHGRTPSHTMEMDYVGFQPQFDSALTPNRMEQTEGYLVPSQAPPPPQPAGQSQASDPYLVDFDLFGATGWATLDQDPWQQGFQ